MKKHTPEPWKAESPYPGKNLVTAKDGGTLICEMRSLGLSEDDRMFISGANARRIVACVNACEGLPESALKPGIIMAQVTQAQELIAQRDELMAALELIMDNDCPLSGNPTHEQLVEHWEYEKTQGRGEADDRLFALAVIAKAKGTSPAQPTPERQYGGVLAGLNGVRVMKDDYLPARNMVVSPDLFEVMKNAAPADGEGV